jgi:hypothetical protein
LLPLQHPSSRQSILRIFSYLLFLSMLFERHSERCVSDLQLQSWSPAIAELLSVLLKGPYWK